MHCNKYLAPIWLLLSYSLVVTVQAQDIIKTTTIDVSVPTTVAPAIIPAPVAANAAAVAASTAIADNGPIKAVNLDTKVSLVNENVAAPLLTTAAPSVTTAAPQLIHPINEASSSEVAVTAGGGLKISPPSVVAAAEDPSLKPAADLVSISNGKTVTTLAPATDGGKPDEKLDQYFAPVCESLDKLQPKQLFKIQTQLKQFVEKTNGKMSACFMTHFKINPSMNLIEKAQLEAICAAKKLANGHFGDFKSCAVQNWEQQLGDMLDKISAARQNCLKNHKHALLDNGTHSLLHDDITSGEDELAYVGTIDDSVGRKALEIGNDVTISKSATKTIELPTTVAPKLVISPPSEAPVIVPAAVSLAPKTTIAPVVVVDVKPTKAAVNDIVGDLAAALSGGSNSNSSKSKLLSDPNTVIVFVDDSNDKLTTTPKPLATLLTSTKPEPDKGVKIEQTKTIVAGSGSTTVETSKKIIATTVSPKSTAKPTSSSSTTPSSQIIVLIDTTNKPAATVKPEPLMQLIKSTESKSLETFQEMLNRQEREKLELEKKLKVEREKLIAQMKKKQDEIDAKNAIKQLQIQRAASIGSHQGHSDAKLHQIEHERQMVIDPVGHSIKHQQYEFTKQQRALKDAIARGEIQIIKGL